MKSPDVACKRLPILTCLCNFAFASEDLGIPVEVRDITRVEPYSSDEAFLCGTGYEITPITSVDDIPIGDDYPSPITKRLAEYYAEILAGNVEKRKTWLTPA